MNIQVQESTINALLTPHVEFRIPDFQRAYAWKKSQIEQFLNDIWEACTEEQAYFIGTIVLINESPSSRGIEAHSVLDGQQRLTTILLILSEIKRRFQDVENNLNSYLWNTVTLVGKSPKLLPQSYGADPTDGSVFRAILADLQQASLDYPKHQMVRAAKDIALWMDEKFGSPCNLEKLNTFAIFFTTQVEIAKINTQTESDAFRLFETLNDRGLPLSKSDLIKNLLFRCASPGSHEAIKESWIVIEQNASNDGADAFLRAFWIAEFSFVRKAALFDVFKSYLTQKPQVVDATEFLINRLEPSSELYNQLRNPEGADLFPEEARPILVRLADSGAKTYIPLLMAAYNYRSEHFVRIARLIESINVRYLMIGQHNPNWLEVLYSNLIGICRDTARSVDELFKFRDLDRISKDDLLILEVDSLQVSPNDSWRNILHDIAKRDFQKETKIGDRKSVHIEHILPQNPREECYDESQLNKETAKEFAHKLGNLTLLYGKLNTKASNRPFSEKKAILERSDIPMTSRIGGLPKWTAVEINERTKALADLICKMFPHPYDI